MKVIESGFLSELAERLSRLYRERQWTPEELLAIILVLSVLLLLILRLWIVRRRWRKAIRSLYLKRLAARPSAAGAPLSGDRKRGGASADAGKVLAAHRSTKHEGPPKGDKIAEQQDESGECAGRSPWETINPKQPNECSTVKEAASTAASSQLRCEEREQAQDRFEQKFAELATANERLRNEVAKLKKTSPKLRIETCKKVHRAVADVRQKRSRKPEVSKIGRSRSVETGVQDKRDKRHRRASHSLAAMFDIRTEVKGPRQMLGELVEDVQELNCQKGIPNRADAKLQAALKASEAVWAGSNEAAITALGELIDVVDSRQHEEDGILKDDAEDLIDAAQEIIKVLSIERESTVARTS